MARTLAENFKSRLADLIHEFRDLHSGNLIGALLREIDLLQSTEIDLLQSTEEEE